MLVLGGHHEAGELARDTLLADEECRKPVKHLLALAFAHRLPVAPVTLEVDLVRVRSSRLGIVLSSLANAGRRLYRRALANSATRT